jgi:hypothetical protein
MDFGKIYYISQGLHNLGILIAFLLLLVLVLWDTESSFPTRLYT